MKILFITTRHPNPPVGGDKLRAFHLLNALLASGHEVDLVSLEHGQENRRTGARTETRFRHPAWMALLNCFLGLASRNPLQVWYFRNRAMAKAVRRALATERYDAVFCHLLRSAQYVEGIRGPKKLIDLTDAISLNYERVRRNLASDFSVKKLIYSLEYRRVLRYEKKLLRKFDRVFLISGKDKEFLSAHTDVANVELVPNGVDSAYFSPVGDSGPGVDIVFVGNMSTVPNEDAALYFALEVFPLVQESVPEATFHIIGANPSPKIQELRRLNRSIRISGAVPDVRACMAGAKVSVAPMRYGAGVQNKILEAMSMGIPTVTTSIGLEGIPARVGSEILVGDSKEELAGAVIRVLRDESLSREMAANSRRFILENFTWDKALTGLRL